jgi:hypothetical protein
MLHVTSMSHQCCMNVANEREKILVLSLLFLSLSHLCRKYINSLTLFTHIFMCKLRSRENCHPTEVRDNEKNIKLGAWTFRLLDATGRRQKIVSLLLERENCHQYQHAMMLCVCEGGKSFSLSLACCVYMYKFYPWKISLVCLEYIFILSLRIWEPFEAWSWVFRWKFFFSCSPIFFLFLFSADVIFSLCV